MYNGDTKGIKDGDKASLHSSVAKIDYSAVN